jgi:outer membrane protein TolC
MILSQLTRVFGLPRSGKATRRRGGSETHRARIFEGDAAGVETGRARVQRRCGGSETHRARVYLLPAAVALAAVAMFLLAGCSAAPARHEDASRQDLAVATKAYRPDGARPPLPELTADSGLPDLMLYALLNNPRVEATFHDWAAAVWAITTARSLPDPMFVFSANIVQSASTLSAGFVTDPGANWPGPGKLPLKADAAYGETLKRRAIFEQELLATALAVKRAWVQQAVLEEEIRRTGDMLSVVDDMEAIARQRLSVGKVTPQDVLRAQMERDRLGSQLASLQDSRRPLEARLRSALGLGPEAAPLPTFAPRLTAEPADFTEQSLLETAFAHNPGLKAMRGEVVQAMALYQLAQKNTVPDYSFGIGLTALTTPVPVSPSFGVTLPIWRDKIAAEVAGGRSGLAAAEARLSAEQLDLAVRFAEAAYAWREADRMVALHGVQLLPKAKAALESARAGYAGGVTNFSDLLDAQREVLEHHMLHAEALGQRELVLAEMSLVILARWPENVTAVLAEPPADSAGDVSPRAEKP